MNIDDNRKKKQGSLLESAPGVVLTLCSFVVPALLSVFLFFFVNFFLYVL